VEPTVIDLDKVRHATRAELTSHSEIGVVVEDVSRWFGRVQALSGMSFSAPYGQVTALVGPNGAGKTTVLLVLASLLRPHRGRVLVAGVDPTVDRRAVRSLVGWMPDVFGVYDQLTVREYLRFFAAAYDLPRNVATKRVSELLAMVHLTEFTDGPVHVLSRGQKQRLALTRALVHEPRVVLLDEPAAGLDPRSRMELREILRGLAASGTAVLVSSHILTELDEVADRVVFVDDGATVGEQTMAELRGSTVSAYRVRGADPDRLASVLRDKQIPHSTVGEAVELPPMTKEEAARTLELLVTSGAGVVAFERVGSDLESVYLSMTEERG
jgi:ABC-2 type transport system ATP-binding protein